MSDPARLRGLIHAYQDFNGPTIDELEREPSPLEFMRYVSRNRPFVVRGAARQWTATRRWNAEYLKQKLRQTPVQVAITPNGRADAPTRAEDGKLYFAKPLERLLPFVEVIEHIVSHGRHEDDDSGIWYAQTQNDNLRGEYSQLFEDVAQDIPWARIALEQEPDAINMWIGSAKSTTVLHRDPYQNIYVQIVGAKRFLLVPPAEMACVNERMLPPASWTADTNSSDSEAKTDEPLRLTPDRNMDPVPSALWDPDLPDENSNVFSSLCQPSQLTLQAGDMLYLPALWYHKVSQIVGLEGFSCSVNYWYDMDFGGGFYAFDRFVREIALQSS